MISNIIGLLVIKRQEKISLLKKNLRETPTNGKSPSGHLQPMSKKEQREHQRYLWNNQMAKESPRKLQPPKYTFQGKIR
jgi:hypothetical protein